MKMVMATTRGLNLALVVHPSIKSSRRSKGQVRRDHQLLRSAVHRFAPVVLEELGLTREQSFPSISEGKRLASTLLNHKVPAAILDPPYTTMAAKEVSN